MHRYFRHIGDYAKDTRHLSLLEHGAYTMLLDLAYSMETPLPTEIPAICRLCCARSKDEQKAVENVLLEFFKMTDTGGWIQGRVLEELADYRDQSDSSRFSNFCKAWKKRHGKKQQIIDLEQWKQLLPKFLGCYPVADGAPFDYRSMTEWYAIELQTSTQEPVPKNQEPVFPPDYPAGHIAALAQWFQYKRERRETYKPTGWASLLKQQLVFTSEQVQQAVEQSVGNNYAGLFTDKIKSAAQKKEGGAAVPVARRYAHPLDAVPEWDWEAVAREIAEEQGWDVTGLQEISWVELSAEHRQILTAAHHEKKKGPTT